MVDSLFMELHFTNMKRGLCHAALGTICILIVIAAGLARAQVAEDDSAQKYADAGQRALTMGQFTEAQSNFEQLAKLHPEVAEVHATLGLIDFKLRLYEAAVGEIRTAQKLKPGLQMIEKAVALRPEDGYIVDSLGWAHYRLGDYASAVEYLEKALELVPDTQAARAHRHPLGMTLRSAEGTGGAGEACEAGEPQARCGWTSSCR